jgi:hypothetical protein
MNSFDKLLKVIFYFVTFINITVGLCEIVAVSITTRTSLECHQNIFDIILACGIMHLLFAVIDIMSGLIKTRCLTTRAHTYSQAIEIFAPFLGALMYYGINNVSCLKTVGHRFLYKMAFVEHIILMIGIFLFIVVILLYFHDKYQVEKKKKIARRNSMFVLTLDKTMPPLPPIEIHTINMINQSP